MLLLSVTTVKCSFFRSIYFVLYNFDVLKFLCLIAILRLHSSSLTVLHVHEKLELNISNHFHLKKFIQTLLKPVTSSKQNIVKQVNQ